MLDPHDPLFPIYFGAGGKYLTGYMNQNGDVVIEPRFVAGRQFSEGLALVTNNWRELGYIDTSGELVIELRKALGGDFRNGRAATQAVVKGRKLVVEPLAGHIDKTGRFVYPPAYYTAKDYSEGRAAVFSGPSGDLGGFIDESGKVVLDPAFPWVYAFSEGLAAVSNGSHLGFVNRDGNFAIPLTFDGDYSPSFFREGLAPIRRGGTWGLIAPSGEWKQSVECEEMSSYFSEGLIQARLNGKWGYVDHSGEFVISPQFHYALDFTEGLARVSWWDGRGASYVDHSGRFPITRPLTNAEPFQNGLAYVETTKEVGYINRAGDFIWKRRWIKIPRIL